MRCWKCGAMGKWTEELRGKLACSRCVRKEQRKGETPQPVVDAREIDALKRENVWLKESKTDLAANVKVLEARVESLTHQIQAYKTADETGYAPMQARLDALEAYLAANESVMMLDADAPRERMKEAWTAFGEARKKVVK